MSELVRTRRSDVAAFRPEQTREKLAELDGDIVQFRALKDWPQLEEAVAAKIEEQAAFVANWKAMVRAAGHQPNNAVGNYLSVDDAQIRWGISQPTVSRWRTSLKDPDRYHERIVLGSFRAAGLEPPENHRAEGTGENEWFTPDRYVEAAREVMGGIDLDPATHPTAQETIRASRFFTRQDDGLTQPWNGRVWLNPPYAQPLIGQFAEKLMSEIKAGRVQQAILLTHNYTDTAWFHLAEAAAELICFTKGRIRFVDIDGEDCSPTQGQAFFYYGEQWEKFREVFAAFGFVR